MPSRPRERLTTYLVASSLEGKTGGHVFAVRTRGAAEALAAVQASVGQGETPVIVGSLSTRTAKAIGLKAGDIRPI